ncbi:MAG: hypothetical protein G01um101448_100 [Parcubacteria group bacterium Gr01-1014_48]|nr:MAG: hypothetical protein Greene041614_21 [Parcubacteria group bacterium Greene0416_14]TSC74459.1 MAG: hypothetical protein G01um101448_100 [Parcubacteria group bacterium Gr01-1014_48]TSD01769.1 MAG: hypothetical protein Greene101415_27 [Parcubacteria group bacterium Greene1014_15]TSD08483.1 MAG: hypothetical protein Greene07144_22 [Parcubacteria group bacterium Greene0714_4]
MAMRKLTSSFRDPSGLLFIREGILYRQIHTSYREDFEMLMNSGLYRELVGDRLLIAHENASLEHAFSKDACAVIKPLFIPFISYPYEWCFGQLQDAARAILAIQKRALMHGMSLKDASAYNIQFVGGKPLLIDTLSFERYREGFPWIAYRQFCQHFLAPLALMSYIDVRLSSLLRLYVDGVPLDLASKLLPTWTYGRFSLLSHIHLHAKSQNYFADKDAPRRSLRMSRASFLGIIESLERAVRNLTWNPAGTEWADYYTDTNYSNEALLGKVAIVDSFLSMISPKTVWDFGGNDGRFSRRASDRKIATICFDNDPAAIEKNYRTVRSKNEEFLLPLILDMANPSPALGWGSEERMSIIERAPVDCAFALALVHHLAIGNNVPFSMIAQFFSRVTHYLIIEFVPKNDSQVKRLLRTREDIFPAYTEKDFRDSFGEFFVIEQERHIDGTERVLYLMRKKPALK